MKKKFYEVSLAPVDLIIEAESEEDLKERSKHISIEHLVFSWKKLSKEDFNKELKTRRIFFK